MAKQIILFLLGYLTCATLSAQELNCKVTVNADQIQGTNRTVFESLEKSITEFMNERRWTDFEYLTEERIECSVYLIISHQSGNSFAGEMQVQSTRPVHNTNYKSPIFSFKDQNVEFSYYEGDALTFDETSFGNNLTEMLAYYAYIIVGTDCDSFALMSGTPFYKKAEDIVNQAQSTNTKGWRAFEDGRNRYALITSIVDDIAKPYREYLYTYHRLGLDEMTISPDKSRNKINDNLTILKEIYKERPSNIIVSEFAETKLDELINVYSKATPTERKNAYDILSYLVPTLQHRMDALK